MNMKRMAGTEKRLDKGEGVEKEKPDLQVGMGKGRKT